MVLVRWLLFFSVVVRRCVMTSWMAGLGSISRSRALVFSVGSDLCIISCQKPQILAFFVFTLCSRRVVWPGTKRLRLLGFATSP